MIPFVRCFGELSDASPSCAMGTMEWRSGAASWEFWRSPDVSRYPACLASRFAFASRSFSNLFFSRSARSRLSTLSSSTQAWMPSTASTGCILHASRKPCNSAVENSSSGIAAPNWAASIERSYSFSVVWAERFSIVDLIADVPNRDSGKKRVKRWAA
jgi:hypothetical protein